jgi:biotin transport system substrate-specific component
MNDVKKESCMATRNTVYVALFAALMVVLSLAPAIPLAFVPVPITLQSLGVMLAGCLLGPVRGALAVLLYVVIAALGFPVLAGGRGGIAAIAGPTGGFLFGMIAGAFVAGWIARLADRRPAALASAGAADRPRAAAAIGTYLCAAIAGGIVMVYALGVPWLSVVTGMGLAKATAAMAAFVPGDLVKALVAALAVYRVRRVMPALGGARYVAPRQ